MTFVASAVVWPDGHAFEGMLWNHWRVGEDGEGHALYAALLDYGAGWRRRLQAQTHYFSSSWALLARSEQGGVETFTILQPDLLCGNPSGPDDASVWSGSVVKSTLHLRDGGRSEVFALFYTARRLEVPRAVLGTGREMDQEVRLAVLRQESLPGDGAPVWRLHRTRFVLRPDPSRHVMADAPGPSVIPAFRDPCVFAAPSGQVYLIVSTRERQGPVDNDASLTIYEVRGALDDPLSYRRVGSYAPGCYVEMENAHVGRTEKGQLVLTFSTGGLGSAPEGTQGATGSLVAVPMPLDAQGSLQFEDEALATGEPSTLLPASVGLYGAWVDGSDYRGFAWDGGGLCRAGPAPFSLKEELDLTTQTHLAAPLGRVSELMDGTHQWDLRRAALFTRDLSTAQREALQSGKTLLAVLNDSQRKLLDDFYSGRV